MATEPMMIAKSADKSLCLEPGMANRHGLISGATGTGKSVSLRVLAEQFSDIGVPVFLADVKGDLSGMSQAGKEKESVQQRIQSMGLTDFAYKSYPVTFWDIFGKQGHPVRTTISDMGPLLLGRLLDLNDTQSATLQIIFRVADENGLLLLDIKDLRAMLEYANQNASDISSEYGLISTQTIGAIQRGVLNLEEQGADKLFSEPALDLTDLMRVTADGRGIINILNAKKLILAPKIYSTFLLWLLSELFEELPEVGDTEKPKMVIFFDEAHLLFDNQSKFLEDKIEQVIRLIRSKGIGIYFVTQSPSDIPETVLGQLGNRIQHALRAYTPKDQKAVKTAAETFRSNPELDVEAAISELGVGEALVSFLDKEGIPSVVERAMVCPPHSQLGPVSDEGINGLVQISDLYGHYEEAVDRESAYEILKGTTIGEADGETGDEATETDETATEEETEGTETTDDSEVYTMPEDRGYAPLPPLPNPPRGHGHYGSHRPNPPRHVHRTPPPPKPRQRRHQPPTLTEVVTHEIIRGVMGTISRPPHKKKPPRPPKRTTHRPPQNKKHKRR